MRHVDEYRDPELVRQLAAELAARVTRPWKVMEICGGQTHAFARFGLSALLPEGLELLHGPGCPVCVTPTSTLDQAIAIASRPGVVFCTYGDMLRVPGSAGDLRAVRAAGGDVRIVYSPLDALTIARALPDREVVFFAIGFETTAPGHALVVRTAAREGLGNFSLLVAHVRVPPAIDALLASPEQRIDGFLAAGHVCTVMGTSEYDDLAARHAVPIVVTGFEPVDLMQGLVAVVSQLEAGDRRVQNRYERVVRTEGNATAQALVDEVFEPCDRPFRGLGVLREGGLALRERFAAFDAERRFGVEGLLADEPPDCRIGLVLTGRLSPPDCPMFGTRCTPDHPLGATMVSSEGACAAYHRYRGVPA